MQLEFEKAAKRLQKDGAFKRNFEDLFKNLTIYKLWSDEKKKRASQNSPKTKLQNCNKNIFFWDINSKKEKKRQLNQNDISCIFAVFRIYSSSPAALS
ncbi:hypothetical protein RFI_10304 [Reticulomyxa filosa]|uniref:Uncharacterized protein n=1 Tax=Reticulomyxa filosa TaxID=46433 RepID=X6NLG6_RETFI|nr:hypothetical protein RFI_10304 [Reticulomyxa filosa]|eukprot:ETO26831.1 hypothetical protein RFI_10304 [Reticulomyxa filosa]